MAQRGAIRGLSFHSLTKSRAISLVTMKLLRHCLALALAGAGLATAATSAAAPIPAKDRVVILITIDGFPAWLWHDPALPVPTLRKLAAEGAVADSMEVVNPSITWICHTTLVTGVGPIQHGVLFNGLLVRQGPDQPPMIEPWRDKSELVRVPTIYDVAHQAGLKTAQVDWVAILNSGTIDYEFLEVPSPPAPSSANSSPPASCRKTTSAISSRARAPPGRPHVEPRRHPHPQGASPEFPAHAYLNTDALNHADGPGSMASYSAYALVDYQIRDLLAGIEAAGLKDKATVIITTDHGFKRVKTGIWPNVALRKAGLIEAEGATVKSATPTSSPKAASPSSTSPTPPNAPRSCRSSRKSAPALKASTKSSTAPRRTASTSHTRREPGHRRPHPHRPNRLRLPGQSRWRRHQRRPQRLLRHPRLSRQRPRARRRLPRLGLRHPARRHPRQDSQSRRRPHHRRAPRRAAPQRRRPRSQGDLRSLIARIILGPRITSITRIIPFVSLV